MRCRKTRPTRVNSYTDVLSGDNVHVGRRLVYLGVDVLEPSADLAGFDKGDRWSINRDIRSSRANELTEAFPACSSTQSSRPARNGAWAHECPLCGQCDRISVAFGCPMLMVKWTLFQNSRLPRCANWPLLRMPFRISPRAAHVTMSASDNNIARVAQ